MSFRLGQMNDNIPILQVLLITKTNRNQPKNQITHRSFGSWVGFIGSQYMM